MEPAPSTRPFGLGSRPQIDRIVVPVVPDAGHDRGIDVAVRWAHRWGLPVHLVSVERTDSGAVDVTVGDRLARARERLADATALTVTEQLVAGPEVDAAIATELADTDLVVMSTSGGAGHPSTSHAWRLLQRWGGPALLVGPEAGAASIGGPVVVGLDGSPLAESALQTATDLARALDARTWLVQVADPTTIEQAQRLRDRGEQVSPSAYVRDTASRLGAQGVPVSWELMQSDDVAGSLAAFATTNRATAIVLSTHGSSGLRAEALGSTCLSVTTIAPVPVLVSLSGAADELSLLR